MILMAQIKTLRKIGERMGWSPSTVLRRHQLDDFPLYPDWTKRGLVWVTSEGLILEWEERKVRMSQGARLREPARRRHKPTYKTYNWRLRDKNRTDNGTVGPQFREKTRPSLHEELAKCGPNERAWVTNHELTAAQRIELGVNLPETSKRDVKLSEPPASAKKCTCGTEILCTAHDNDGSPPCPCGIPSRCKVHPDPSLNEKPAQRNLIDHELTSFDTNIPEPPKPDETLLSREEPTRGLPPTAPPLPSLTPNSDCTCGTPISCAAHD